MLRGSLGVLLAVIMATASGFAQQNQVGPVGLRIPPSFLVVPSPDLRASAIVPGPGRFDARSSASRAQVSLRLTADTVVPERLALRRGLFRPLKFTVGDGRRQRVYAWHGLAFHSEFEQALSGHPAALRQARRAYPYNAMSLIGVVGMVGVSAKTLINTIVQAVHVSNGELVGGGVGIGDLVVLGTSGLVAIVGGRLGQRQLNKAVGMYNADLGR